MTVRVWTLRVHDVPADASALSDEERVREAAYRRPEDRLRFRGGALLVRAIGARSLGVPPGEVPVDRTCPDCGAPHGRPELPTGAPQVSVSHSGAWVAVGANTSGAVGLDIESAEPEAFAELADQILSPVELARGPHDGLDLRRTWVRKEALLKLAGVGLRVPMTTITLGEPSHAFGPVDLVDLELEGTPAALATAGPDRLPPPELLSGAELLGAARLPQA